MARARNHVSVGVGGGNRWHLRGRSAAHFCGIVRAYHDPTAREKTHVRAIGQNPPRVYRGAVRLDRTIEQLDS